MKCKICGHKVSEYGQAKIMNKYTINYYKCDSCGFIQTEEPYWLEESYSSPIANSDIGILSRNITLNQKVAAIINGLFGDKSDFLDYGGGYGIFVRMMRDSGFDFQWYDKWCENIFAVGHEQNKDRYDLVTAFELMEHLPNPREEFGHLCSIAGNIICSTELQPIPSPKLDKWWYYCLDHGQHISIFTEKAMMHLAEENGKYYTHCGEIHLFSSQPINKFKFSVCCRVPQIINRMFNRESLLSVDYEKLTGKSIE